MVGHSTKSEQKHKWSTKMSYQNYICTFVPIQNYEEY